MKLRAEIAADVALFVACYVIDRCIRAMRELTR